MVPRGNSLVWLAPVERNPQRSCCWGTSDTIAGAAVIIIRYMKYSVNPIYFLLTFMSIILWSVRGVMERRAAVYIDGFNLYHGMRDMGWRKYLWLDLQNLSEKLLPHNHQPIIVRYFTAARLGRAKAKRQKTYIEALETRRKLTIHYGRFNKRRQEKKSDVNLAVELTCDAFTDVFDTAIIVSGDTDFAGMVRTIRQRFPNKALTMAFPPARNKYVQELKEAASKSFTITEQQLMNSQMPSIVYRPDGHQLIQPNQWR